MAFNGKKYALALKVQTAAGVLAGLSLPADLMLCYDVQPGGDVFSIANPEATGTRNKRGDIQVGRNSSVTFNVIIRGPGGTAPPAADTFVPGRILRAVGFKEEVQAAPLLLSGAITGGNTNSGILPVGASGSNDFYNGLPAILSDQGAGVKGITSIVDYIGASRTALFAETFSAAPAGQVSIPAFLGYRYWDSAPDILLSVSWWLDKKRYNMIDGVVTQFERNIGTSNNGDANFTYYTVTIQGDVAAIPEADEISPNVAEGGAIPIFRDADWWLDRYKICGSGATSSFQIETDRAPCPNNASGGEAAQQISVSRQWALNLNEVLLSEKDFNALAKSNNESGTTASMWLQYGSSSGRVVSITACDGRLGYSNAVIGGNFVTRAPTLFVDAVEKSESIIFPYF